MDNKCLKKVSVIALTAEQSMAIAKAVPGSKYIRMEAIIQCRDFEQARAVRTLVTEHIRDIVRKNNEHNARVRARLEAEQRSN